MTLKGKIFFFLFCLLGLCKVLVEGAICQINRRLCPLWPADQSLLSVLEYDALAWIRYCMRARVSGKKSPEQWGRAAQSVSKPLEALQVF